VGRPASLTDDVVAVVSRRMPTLLEALPANPMKRKPLQ
jgi:hypothetical protein